MHFLIKYNRENKMTNRYNIEYFLKTNVFYTLYDIQMYFFLSLNY